MVVWADGLHDYFFVNKLTLKVQVGVWIDPLIFVTGGRFFGECGGHLTLRNGATEKVRYCNNIGGSTIASSNILRFPRASVEPPRTTVLRGLAELLLPAGVSVYSRCLVKWKNNIFKIHHFSVAPC
jgi:hypothetical protein